MAEAPSAVARAAALFWNGDEGRVRALWRIIAQLATQFALTWLPLAAALLFLRGRVSPWSGTALVGVAAGRLVATLASVGLASRLLDRRRLADLGLRLDGDFGLDLAFGLTLGALLMSGVFAAERAAGWVSVTDAWHGSDPGRSFALALLTPLAVFLMVGVYEELGVRGYLLRNLAEGLKGVAGSPRAAVLGAVLLSSALFGLGHAGNPNATVVSTVNVAAAGILLALGYVLTGRLALPIGLHITWNFFQGSVYGFPVSGVTALSATFIATRQEGPAAWTGGAFGPEAGLVGLAAMFAGCGLILVWARVRYGRIALVVALAEPPAAKGPAGIPPPARYADASASASPPPGAGEAAR